MNPQDISVPIKFARPFLEKLQLLCREIQLTPQEVAIGYFKLSQPEASVVFGAETVEQVTQNIKCWQKEVPPVLIPSIQDAFKDVPEYLLDPGLWPE